MGNWHSRFRMGGAILACMMTRLRSSPYSDWIVALLLLAGFAALYVLTRTGVHTFDALSYTYDVEYKPLLEVFHPHHLLYGPAGKLAVTVAQMLGYTGRSDQPIQALNALAGALGVLALWRFGVCFSGRRWLSLGAASLIGMCFAYWFYATEVEVYTLAALFLSVCLWMLAKLEQQRTVGRLILLGLALAGAVMFHQTNVLFALPISAFLLARRDWRGLLLVGVVSGMAVALPYLLVAYASGLRDWDGFYRWASGYTQTGQWGGYLGLEHLPALWEGLRNSISPHNSLLATLFYGLVIVCAALTLPALWRRGRAWIALVLVWLTLYGAFFWWWEPWNIEFWIALLPLWALLCFGALRALESARLRMITGGAAGVLAGALFAAHLAPIQAAADPATDYYQQVTAALMPQLDPLDLVVARGNILDLYVPFYARHPAGNLVSLRKLSFRGDAFWMLHTQLREAHAIGQTIYLDQMILDEPASQERNPFGFSAEQIALLRQDFPIEPAIRLNEQVVFYAINARPAADTTSWHFGRSLGGWRSAGAPQPRYENGGWCFSGGADVWLQSPPLALDSRQFSSIEIEISSDRDGLFGQLFWRGIDQDLSEQRSLRFDLVNGREVFQLDLSASPDWQGSIAALRLDPAQDAGEATICLIRLEIRE